MKAVVEKKASNFKSRKMEKKQPSVELSETEMHRIRNALVNPAVEEPSGALAGSSFSFR
ncbi:hypothetical protein J2Y39_000454 [Pseudomonas sp. 2957]|jgi:hypothetical protein|uniref:Uncharacterized protein n=1 Tax=Pseudomonas siliginis TaxID=2842346 RepID=A0ABY5CGK4_9PSED|nr:MULTISPECIES: hypothetical protein [Pseudomonas]MDR6945874.1 hypothetical protein [Pseudomonas sp. 2957]MEB2652959.1 hypothetical protein [Pseudomonas siliginis]UST75792.1 hypothetical protein NF675_06800 [Pseudomonas siliginis]UST81152.1 hypothetical protein NF676_07480 [Pseudomonas siliginis]UST86402.1 hypothetical protein NF677_06900 [Pseudomonas siliginis]